MSIYIGDTEITNIKLGGNDVNEVYVGSDKVRPVQTYVPYCVNDNTLLYLSPDGCYAGTYKNCGWVCSLHCTKEDYCIGKIFNCVYFYHCLCNNSAVRPLFFGAWSLPTSLYCSASCRNKIYYTGSGCAIDLWGCTNTFKGLGGGWVFYGWTSNGQQPYFIIPGGGSIGGCRTPEWYNAGSSSKFIRCFVGCCVGDIIMENQGWSVDKINQYVENTKSKYGF